MIYFDNAATSFPKAPNIKNLFCDYIDSYAVNANRGAYGASYRLEEKIVETREKIKTFFKANCNYETIFTSGVTFALNLFINGNFKKDDEVLVSSLEHNAVMRPLFYLMSIRKISYKVLPCLPKIGVLQDSKDFSIQKALQDNISTKTRAVIINHSSNVTGAINDIYKIGECIKEINKTRSADKQILYCIDTAASAGSTDIDVSLTNADFIAFSSHKGLLSLPGSGGAIVKKSMLKTMKPLIYGGTGSLSHSFEMPLNFPDRFESGTQNIFGILSLGESLDYINEMGLSNIEKKKKELHKYFIESILTSPLSSVYTIEGFDKNRIDNYTPTVSLTHKTRDIAEIAYILDKDYNIATRVGLHCSPLAHKTIGTFDKGGTLRFSFSHFNTESEIDVCIKALRSFL